MWDERSCSGPLWKIQSATVCPWATTIHSPLTCRIHTFELGLRTSRFMPLWCQVEVYNCIISIVFRCQWCSLGTGPWYCYSSMSFQSEDLWTKEISYLPQPPQPPTNIQWWPRHKIRAFQHSYSRRGRTEDRQQLLVHSNSEILWDACCHFLDYFYIYISR